MERHGAFRERRRHSLGIRERACSDAARKPHRGGVPLRVHRLAFAVHRQGGCREAVCRACVASEAGRAAAREAGSACRRRQGWDGLCGSGRRREASRRQDARLLPWRSRHRLPRRHRRFRGALQGVWNSPCHRGRVRERLCVRRFRAQAQGSRRFHSPSQGDAGLPVVRQRSARGARRRRQAA